MTLRDIFIRNPNEDAKVVKEYGWERVHLVLTENWTKLIGLNFLYLLCCVPIVTIPAATCAMTAKAPSSGSMTPRCTRSSATATASAMRGTPNGTGARQ